MSKINAVLASAVFLVSGLCCVGGTAAQASSTLATPEVKLTTEDFSWLRGRFPDSPEKEQLEWRALKNWSDQQVAKRTAAIEKDLQKVGVSQTAVVDQRRYTDDISALIDNADDAAGNFKTWSEFQATFVEARFLFSAYLAACKAAEDVTRVSNDAPLRDRLRAAVVGEQVLRSGLHWKIPLRDTTAPTADKVSLVFDVLLWSEISQRDHENTRLIKQIIANSGWPSISSVGQDASEDAWLLVQHADDDPVFQLQVLRLIGPLIATNEVAPQSYALLSDRVSLKISGTQRYGTQLSCVGGHYVPNGLEGPSRVNERRKALGMKPLEQYEKQFPASCH